MNNNISSSSSSSSSTLSLLSTPPTTSVSLVMTKNKSVNTGEQQQRENISLSKISVGVFKEMLFRSPVPSPYVVVKLTEESIAHLVIIYKRADLLKAVIENNMIDITYKNKYGYDVVTLAIIKRSYDCLNVLLDNFPEIINTKYPINNVSYLHIAIRAEISDSLIVGALLRAGANIFATDNNGATALHYAAYLGKSPDIIKMLLFVCPEDKMSDYLSMKYCSPKGEYISPLMIAFNNAHMDNFMTLLQYHAKHRVNVDIFEHIEIIDRIFDSMNMDHIWNIIEKYKFIPSSRDFYHLAVKGISTLNFEVIRYVFYVKNFPVESYIEYISETFYEQFATEIPMPSDILQPNRYYYDLRNDLVVALYKIQQKVIAFGANPDNSYIYTFSGFLIDYLGLRELYNDYYFNNDSIPKLTLCIDDD